MLSFDGNETNNQNPRKRYNGVYKHKLGAKVEVISYGFLVYQPKDEPNYADRPIYSTDDEGYTYDIFPQWIGLQGEILEVIPHYLGTRYLVSTPGDPREYYHDQLKNIETNG